MRPERLIPTRVYRFYQGGLLIDRLRGEPERDTDHPEDWVGSVTAANNPGRDEPEAGLSRLAGGGLLRDAIAADPEGWLGPAAAAGTTGVLVKLLDAAQRLPVHAHPSRAFAAEHLGSPFGKTEAWIVLATREEHADVWIGLREPVDAATYQVAASTGSRSRSTRPRAPPGSPARSRPRSCRTATPGAPPRTRGWDGRAPAAAAAASSSLTSAPVVPAAAARPSQPSRSAAIASRSGPPPASRETRPRARHGRGCWRPSPIRPSPRDRSVSRSGSPRSGRSRSRPGRSGRRGSGSAVPGARR